MRGRSSRCGLGTSRFDHDDGLAERHLASGGNERTRVPHRLHVDQDALRVRIISKVVEQVAPAYVQHGTRGNNRAEAYFFALAPIEDGRQQCAALAEERDVPGFGRVFGEGGVQPNCWRHDAKTVGADQPHQTALQVLADLLLQGRALRPALAKARGNHHRCFHARIHTLADHRWHGLRRGDDNSQVHFDRDLANALVRVQF